MTSPRPRIDTAYAEPHQRPGTSPERHGTGGRRPRDRDLVARVDGKIRFSARDVP
jgi:hypothetical protein